MSDFNSSEEKVDTGWVRYRIGSSASKGSDEWMWCPGFDSLEEEDRHSFLTDHETWTRFHRHSLEYWTGEMPPREILVREIEGAQRGIQSLQDKLKVLYGQI